MVAVLQLGDIVNVMSSPRQWDDSTSLLRVPRRKDPLRRGGGQPRRAGPGSRRPAVQKDPGPYNTFINSFRDYRLDGRYAAGDNRNGYRLLTAGDVELMVLNLDFGSPDAVLAWAGQVVDAHPSRHVVVVTHDYLGTDNLWRGATDRDDPTLPHNHNPSLNDGVDVWNEFVRLHPNVQFVLNGHDVHQVSAAEPWAAGRLVSDNDVRRQGLPDGLQLPDLLRPAGAATCGC